MNKISNDLISSEPSTTHQDVERGRGVTKTVHIKQRVDGIVIVNKPINLTSNAVLQRVKHLYHAKKAGHTGSLDPMATGMLPLCFGEATKVSQFLLDADKCYEVTGLLGVKTNTGDAMGEVIATTTDFTITHSMLTELLSGFTGPIQQVPPMFSALKHKGLPLYKLARAGIEIERKPRNIVIHDLQLNDFDGKQLKLTVRCSKGTYIRSLIEDIGECLGVGAHVTQLHRCYTAGFEGVTMYSLDELMAKSPEQLMDCLLPTDRAIQGLPIVHLSNEQVLMLYQGKMIEDLTLASNIADYVRLYENDTTFIGLGEIEEAGVLKAKRLIAREMG
ncbi:MAG: tRNA pseudouridine(55) synthase TruB [Legionellaceae bacterium]|nr:tRNA pseudouridine(55) synthase TruB [Legionellaceae bacterium]